LVTESQPVVQNQTEDALMET